MQIIQCNTLRILPKGIGNLHNLQVLGLADNQVVALPEEIKRLQGLQKLYVCNNPVAALRIPRHKGQAQVKE